MVPETGVTEYISATPAVADVFPVITLGCAEAEEISIVLLAPVPSPQALLGVTVNVFEPVELHVIVGLLLVLDAEDPGPPFHVYVTPLTLVTL